MDIDPQPDELSRSLLRTKSLYGQIRLADTAIAIIGCVLILTIIIWVFGHYSPTVCILPFVGLIVTLQLHDNLENKFISELTYAKSILTSPETTN